MGNGDGQANVLLNTESVATEMRCWCAGVRRRTVAKEVASGINPECLRVRSTELGASAAASRLVPPQQRPKFSCFERTNAVAACRLEQGIEQKWPGSTRRRRPRDAAVEGLAAQTNESDDGHAVRTRSLLASLVPPSYPSRAVSPRANRPALASNPRPRQQRQHEAVPATRRRAALLTSSCMSTYLPTARTEESGDADVCGRVPVRRGRDAETWATAAATRALVRRPVKPAFGVTDIGCPCQGQDQDENIMLAVMMAHILPT
ncbi:hypothetical protein RJ55_06776 [Drechmeria coniospora]|nr:hypothetical protein RJ55_06776 [Drechmeria coniospora]